MALSARAMRVITHAPTITAAASAASCLAAPAAVAAAAAIAPRALHSRSCIVRSAARLPVAALAHRCFSSTAPSATAATSTGRASPGPAAPVVSAADVSEADALLEAWEAMSDFERSEEHPSFVASLFFRLMRQGRNEEAWRVHSEAEALLLAPPLPPSDPADASPVVLGPDGIPLATAGVEYTALPEPVVWDLARTRAWLTAFEHFGWPGHIAEAERVWLRLLHAGAQSSRRKKKSKQVGNLALGLTQTCEADDDGVGVLQPDVDLFVQMIRLYMLHGGASQLAKIDAFWEDARARSHFTSAHFADLITCARKQGLSEQVTLWLERSRVAGAFSLLPEDIRFAELLNRKEELLQDLRNVTVRAVARFPVAGMLSASSDRVLPAAVSAHPEFLRLREDARGLLRRVAQMVTQPPLLIQHRIRPAEFAELLDALDAFNLHAEQAVALFGILQRQELRLSEKPGSAASASDAALSGALPYEQRFPLAIVERLLASVARGCAPGRAPSKTADGAASSVAAAPEDRPASSALLDVLRAMWSPALQSRLQLPSVPSMARRLAEFEAQGWCAPSTRHAFLARLETVLPPEQLDADTLAVMKDSVEQQMQTAEEADKLALQARAQKLLALTKAWQGRAQPAAANAAAVRASASVQAQQSL